MFKAGDHVLDIKNNANYIVFKDRQTQGCVSSRTFLKWVVMYPKRGSAVT